MTARREVWPSIDLHPGFAPSTKSPALAFPAVAEVLAHPSMAFVPSTAWRHGQELALRRPGPAFWIDLAPPPVAAYLPMAEALNRSGQLEAENAFLLTALPRSAVIDAVGIPVTASTRPSTQTRLHDRRIAGQLISLPQTPSKKRS